VSPKEIHFYFSWFRLVSTNFPGQIYRSPAMAPERIDRLLSEVQEWYKAHNVSQTELARLIGVNPQHITEWKKGRSRPSAENALAMLELLKTKPKGKGSTR
jgi:DNA-binding transcriptional regulator YiaG